jgi:hypothetical protein
VLLTEHHAMEAYWGSRGIAPVIHSLTSAVGCELSALRPGRFIPTERAPGTHSIICLLGNYQLDKHQSNVGHIKKLNCLKLTRGVAFIRAAHRVTFKRMKRSYYESTRYSSVLQIIGSCREHGARGRVLLVGFTDVTTPVFIWSPHVPPQGDYSPVV